MIKDAKKGVGEINILKYTLPDNIAEEEAVRLINNGEIKPYETKTFKNTWLQSGINHILKVATGQSSQTFSTSNCVIGVGDNDTPTNPLTHNDLLATTNKSYKSLESGSPTNPVGGGFMVSAKWLTNEGNFDWKEVVFKNTAAGVCWNRAVSDIGTKTNDKIWVLTMTLSLA